MAFEGENLFTKKPEREFFKSLEDEATARGQVAVLLKGFDNNERNLIIDQRVYKMKQASREHTIKDWFDKCVKAFINKDVVAEWSRIATAMNEIGKDGGKSAGEGQAAEMMSLMEAELKTVHDVMGKKWREANSKEASVARSFALLFSLLMVFDLEETWLLYAQQNKAAVNKQFKVFGTSWKKTLANEKSMLGVDDATYQAVCDKLEQFDRHINHVEGLDIKFPYNVYALWSTGAADGQVC